MIFKKNIVSHRLSVNLNGLKVQTYFDCCFNFYSNAQNNKENATLKYESLKKWLKKLQYFGAKRIQTYYFTWNLNTHDQFKKISKEMII